MPDDDAAAGEPKTPEYGSPTGADAGLPLYGSSDSVEPVESTVADFDPKAERRKKTRANRAAAAARTERARRASKEAKAAAAAAANKAERKALLARTKDAHEAAARRRAERVARRRASPPARLVGFYRERQRRREAYEAERLRARAIAWRRARVAGVIVVAVLAIGGITTAVVVETRSQEQQVAASDRWSAYPGYDSTEFEEVTQGPSQEEIVAADTAMLEEVRVAISEEAGLDWLPYGNDVVTARENAWDGPSMLNDWDSPQWYSTDRLTSLSTKRAVVDRVTEILTKNGFESVELRNDPAQFGGDDDLLADLYGGTTLDTQVVWVLGANRLHGAFSSFELRITDLSQDGDGEFAKMAEFRETSGEIPVNSIVIDAEASLLLPAADRDEFIERAEPFSGEDPPRSN